MTHMDRAKPERVQVSGGMGAAVALALLVLVLPGCGSPNTVEQEDRSEPVGITRETVRGPVTLRLLTDRKELTIAEKLKLELQVEADEAYDVSLPPIGDKLNQFGIVDYHTAQPKLLDNGHVLLSRSYVLEPFLSGEYVIPPMTVSFGKRDDPADQGHEVQTEEIEITVASLLPEAVEKLDVRDIAPPVELPASPYARLWWLLGGALVLVGVCGFAVRRLLRRRETPPAPPPPPAHVIAYAELRDLVAEDLVAKGLLKPFYRRISGILRTYIENRFGLHAPERTTEEFLHEIGSDNSTLTNDHQELLDQFLTHCDMVKFAEHIPGKAEVQGTFDACKRFIEQTKEATE